MRARARGGVETRFENFDLDFHERMRKAFVEIARRQPDRCRLIDATGSEEAVAAAIWDAVKSRFDL
ncbi:thymidylate kinase [compost metagenome]